jgi:hypothetical protein
MPFVYLHRDCKGKAYYVGKATNKERAFSKNSRSVSWKEINKQSGNFNVQLIEVDSAELASELEQLILDEVSYLVNKKKTSDERLDYNKINWASFVRYDEKSPTFLTYLSDSNCRNPKYKRKAGEPAGNTRKVDGKPCATKLGYKGHNYNVHRIIWVLFYGNIDKNFVVNHVDCDPSNNSIQNLELVTTQENCRKNSSFVHNKPAKSSVTNEPYIHLNLLSDSVGTYRFKFLCKKRNIRKTKSFKFNNKVEMGVAFNKAVTFKKDYFKNLVDFNDRLGTGEKHIRLKKDIHGVMRYCVVWFENKKEKCKTFAYRSEEEQTVAFNKAIEFRNFIYKEL